MTTRARGSESFILCFDMKNSIAKRAKVHFAHFVQRDQQGIVAEHFTNDKVLF